MACQGWRSKNIAGSLQEDVCLPSRPTASMLTLDITGLLPGTLQAIVSRYCAQFGHVQKVRLSLYNHRDRCAVAEVEMSTQGEAGLVAAEVGDSHEGTKVVIMIAPKLDEYASDSDALRRFAGSFDLDRRIKAAGLVI